MHLAVGSQNRRSMQARSPEDMNRELIWCYDGRPNGTKGFLQSQLQQAVLRTVGLILRRNSWLFRVERLFICYYLQIIVNSLLELEWECAGVVGAGTDLEYQLEKKFVGRSASWYCNFHSAAKRWNTTWSRFIAVGLDGWINRSFQSVHVSIRRSSSNLGRLVGSILQQASIHSKICRNQLILFL